MFHFVDFPRECNNIHVSILVACVLARCSGGCGDVFVYTLRVHDRHTSNMSSTSVDHPPTRVLVDGGVPSLHVLAGSMVERPRGSRQQSFECREGVDAETARECTRDVRPVARESARHSYILRSLRRGQRGMPPGTVRLLRGPGGPLRYLPVSGTSHSLGVYRRIEVPHHRRGPRDGTFGRHGER